MCKDCQWWPSEHTLSLVTYEDIVAGLRKHGYQTGYSGYGGAAWLFKTLLDDKETLDSIRYFIEAKIQKETDPLMITKLRIAAEQAKFDRTQMAAKIKELLE